MKKSKRILSLLLSIVMILGTFGVGFTGVLSLKAGATMEDPTALNGQFRVDSNGNFKILQIADLQDHAEADGKTNIEFRSINMIKIAVARLKPDLVVFTGDNIYQSTGSHDRDDKYIKDDFLYSVQIVIDALDGTPFAVTYGNHDVERNDGLSLKDQQAIYDKLGAVKLCQDGLTITDTSDNSTSKYGTGYIDVYSADGSKVVERVILLNSGTYENGTGYDGVGFGRPGVGATDFTNHDYANVVAAVNKWTSDPAVKCIGYQHIQLREMFDADTPLLIQGGTVNSNTTKKFYPPSYGKTWTPNPAANPTGEYLEPCGCSGASTRELFNAYAKSNVVGVFFGHDHSNTVCGTVTAGGRSLYMGYGGGMDMYSDYAEDLPNGWGYDPRNSFYTVNANGTLTKDNLTYYGLLRNWNYNEYGSDQTYISEVRLFAANSKGSANDGVIESTFDQAVQNCLNAGFIPLRTAYNRNKNNGNHIAVANGGFPINVYNNTVVADFNYNCYQWDGQTGAYAVCIGYKTTNNPREAITDIRFGNITDQTHTQKLSATVNNAITDSAIMQAYGCGHGINPQTSGTQTVTYYNANYNWNFNGTTAASSGKRSEGDVKFNQGLSIAGTTWDTYLFYTKDPVAGLPVSRIFADITSEYNGNDIEPVSTFNKNRYPQEYPYTWTQSFFSDVYDLDRNNFAFNVKSSPTIYDDNYFSADNFDANGPAGYTWHIRGGTANEKSCSAHIGLVRALPTGKSMTITKPTGGASTQTGPTIIVPDTIYLAPGSTSVAGFYDNNSSGAAVSGGLSDTAHYYFSGTGCTLTDVSVSGATLNINKTNQTISKTSSSCSGVSAGGTKVVEWTFTYQQGGATKTAKAYSTAYAPFMNGVAAIAVAHAKDTYYATSGVYTSLFGIQEVVSSYTSSLNLDSDYNHNSDAGTTGTWNYTLTNHTSTPPAVYLKQTGGLATMVTSDSSFNAASKSGAAYFRSSPGDGTTNVDVAGGTGRIYYEPQRYTYIGQLPNLYVHSFFVDCADEKESKRVDNISGWSKYYVKSSDGTTVASSKYDTDAHNSTGSNSVREGTSPDSLLDSIALGDGYTLYNVVYRGFRRKAALGSGSSARADAVVACQFVAVDKSTLRSKVQEAVVKQQIDNDAYMGILSDASQVLGNPASSQQDVTNAIEALNNAMAGVFVKTAQVTVNYKSNSGLVLDTVKQECFYNDTVTPQVRRYNGYTAPSAPAAWTANSATKTFDLTYTRNNYTITFDTRGGNSVNSINYTIEDTLRYSSSQTISNQLGGVITIPGAPTLSGHTFKGWKVAEASPNSNWIKGTVYQPNDVTGYKYGNVTLIAVEQVFYADRSG